MCIHKKVECDYYCVSREVCTFASGIVNVVRHSIIAESIKFDIGTHVGEYSSTNDQMIFERYTHSILSYAVQTNRASIEFPLENAFRGRTNTLNIQQKFVNVFLFYKRNMVSTHTHDTFRVSLSVPFGDGYYFGENCISDIGY